MAANKQRYVNGRTYKAWCSALGWLMAAALSGFSEGTSSPGLLLGRQLYQAVETGEGRVPTPVGFEASLFCKIYQCIGASGPLGTTGDTSWVIQPVGADAVKALRLYDAGQFVPEIVIHTENNVVYLANLSLDTKVRPQLSATSLNLIRNLTRSILGGSISAQKITVCYHALLKQANCEVGGGTVRMGNSTIRMYSVRFRTVDDGEGYSVVNYTIGIEDQ